MSKELKQMSFGERLIFGMNEAIKMTKTKSNKYKKKSKHLKVLT